MSRPQLVLATRNSGKILEIKQLLGGVAPRLLTYEEFQDWPVLEESGLTFEENARLKARELSRWAQLPALADDSGLEAEALGGRPGVRSSRYAGEEGNARANMALLLKEIEGIPDERRKARFVCVISLFNPDGRSLEIRESCEGRIAHEPKGKAGFGYDPVFVPEGMERTMAQLSPEEKNAISHRGKALRRLQALLEAGRPEWLFELS